MSTKPLFAAVDLGTNTFHLLIGSVSEDKVEPLVRERIFVKVASDGIGTIGDRPFARAIEAAARLGALLRQHEVQAVVAFGTAALRTASNGEILRKRLSLALGVEIELIDGQREAALIARGVLSAELPSAENYLIMDIGGGSVEFVLAATDGIRYRESFPVGAQVLRQRFHKEEPFDRTPHGQVAAFKEYLQLALAPMLAACGSSRPQLLGSSGTFDVLSDLYGVHINEAVSVIPVDAVKALFTEASSMNERERFADARLPDDRADMIVVALGLIDFVLDAIPQTQIVACAYALKEGALLELSERSASL